MFSGLVEETGSIRSITPRSDAIEFAVQARKRPRRDKVGDSVAVNGCCLTVEKIAAGRLYFSVLQESWRLTNLQHAQPGASVNLERALRVGGSLGGHFVTGHIDGMGKIIRWERDGRDHVLEVSAAGSILRQMVRKASIAVDGISLTVADLGKKSFRVWIIPHTHKETALRERKLGDYVNLETDLLGKYVERILNAR